jgi:hypothetical protein
MEGAINNKLYGLITYGSSIIIEIVVVFLSSEEFYIQITVYSKWETNLYYDSHWFGINDNCFVFTVWLFFTDLEPQPPQYN